MKIIERLYQYFEYKGIKPTSLEKKIGISNGYFNTMHKRNADIGEGVLLKIVEYSLDLSPMWLVFGEGEMIKNDIILPESGNKYLIDKVCELSAKNAILEAEIELLKKDKRYKSIQHTDSMAAEPELKPNK